MSWWIALVRSISVIVGPASTVMNGRCLSCLSPLDSLLCGFGLTGRAMLSISDLFSMPAMEESARKFRTALSKSSPRIQVQMHQVMRYPVVYEIFCDPSALSRVRKLACGCWLIRWSLYIGSCVTGILPACFCASEVCRNCDYSLWLLSSSFGISALENLQYLLKR